MSLFAFLFRAIAVLLVFVAETVMASLITILVALRLMRPKGEASSPIAVGA